MKKDRGVRHRGAQWRADATLPFLRRDAAEKYGVLIRGRYRRLPDGIVWEATRKAPRSWKAQRAFQFKPHAV